MQCKKQNLKQTISKYVKIKLSRGYAYGIIRKNRWR